MSLGQKRIDDHEERLEALERSAMPELYKFLEAEGFNYAIGFRRMSHEISTYEDVITSV
jgi:hypothetical protein